jgi:hypothetical protein
MTRENFHSSFRHAGLPATLHGSPEARIAELEVENQRLQLLVAELLLKNQQLRRQEA